MQRSVRIAGKSDHALQAVPVRGLQPLKSLHPLRLSCRMEQEPTLDDIARLADQAANLLGLSLHEVCSSELQPSVQAVLLASLLLSTCL